MVSPGKYYQARDHKAKFGEYARGGVLEYWLIDTERQQAEFYHVDEKRQSPPQVKKKPWSIRPGLFSLLVGLSLS
jgi:Uma2 family endonuclease